MKLVIPNDFKHDVWITSDTHYGHKNLCRGVTEWRTPEGEIPIDITRDFQNLEMMNSTIVNNINAVVKQDDVLIHGGDWSFGGFDNIKGFWDRLICKHVFLVLGNHDHHIDNNKVDIRLLFDSVSDRIELTYKKQLIIIDHYPLSSWQKLGKGSIMLHGHCHLPNKEKNMVGRRMDIGLDGHLEFRPYHLYNECVLPLLNRPIESDISDHHFEKSI